MAGMVKYGAGGHKLTLFCVHYDGNLSVSLWARGPQRAKNRLAIILGRTWDESGVTSCKRSAESGRYLVSDGEEDFVFPCFVEARDFVTRYWLMNKCEPLLRIVDTVPEHKETKPHAGVVSGARIIRECA